MRTRHFERPCNGAKWDGIGPVIGCRQGLACAIVKLNLGSWTRLVALEKNMYCRIGGAKVRTKDSRSIRTTSELLV